MIRTVLVLVLVASGWASQYAKGVELDPIYNRTTGRATPAIRQDHEQFDGYAAARYPEDIDTVWVVCPEDTKLECRTLLVIDCASSNDGTLDWMYAGNIVLEIDHNSAVAWDTVGYGIRVNVYEWVRKPVAQFAYD